MTLKLILFLAGIIFCVIYQFNNLLDEHCPSLSFDVHSEPTLSTIWVCAAVSVTIVFSLELCNCLFCFITLGKRFLPSLLFLLHFLACFIYISTDTKSLLIYNAIIMTGFINLFLSLSDSILCGKYIFIAIGVLKTLLKVATPVLLLLFSLAATEFVLRYEEVVVHELKKCQTCFGKAAFFFVKHSGSI